MKNKNSVKFTVLSSLLFLNAACAFAAPISYSIPVSDPQLQKYSKILLNVNCITHDQAKVIDYVLPAELTGSPMAISMRNSVKAPNDFLGNNAAMTCNGKTCVVKYRDLNIDEEQVAEAIFYASNDFAEFRGKLAVARSFKIDAGGIILGNPAIYCH